MKRFKEWQYYHLEMSLENEENDKEGSIDMMTWKQWINNALKRTHGLFGEALEYSILNQDDTTAYLKVNFNDKDDFASAINTYISNEELIGIPAIIRIQQETSNLKSLEVSEDDLIWYRRALEENEEN